MTRTEYHPYELAVEELTTELYHEHLDSLNGTIAQLRAENKRLAADCAAWETRVECMDAKIGGLESAIRRCRCGYARAR